jgi:hypothetical protein
LFYSFKLFLPALVAIRGKGGSGSAPCGPSAESIEWFIEDQAFLPCMICLPPPPHQQARPETHRKTENERQLADKEVGGGGGWGRVRAKSYEGE